MAVGSSIWDFVACTISESKRTMEKNKFQITWTRIYDDNYMYIYIYSCLYIYIYVNSMYICDHIYIYIYTYSLHFKGNSFFLQISMYQVKHSDCGLYGTVDPSQNWGHQQSTNIPGGTWQSVETVETWAHICIVAGFLNGQEKRFLWNKASSLGIAPETRCRVLCFVMSLALRVPQVLHECKANLDMQRS